MSELTKWDYRWLDLAKYVSQWSKDPSTKVGAVIARGKNLISLGYNGFPATCEDKEEWLYDRKFKHRLVAHAELNAILNSFGPISGGCVYTYPLAPCVACSTILASAGITRVVSTLDPNASSTSVYGDTTESELILNANNIPFHWCYYEDH